MSADARALLADLCDARARTLALVADLDGERWLGPRLDIVNPPLWEIGHVGWFLEWWVLRQGLGRATLFDGADACYDSMAVAHGSRWHVPLPSPERTLRYLQQVFDEVMALLERGDLDLRQAHLVRLATLHEDMHGEALLQSRQTLGEPPPPSAPPPSAPPPCASAAGPLPGDVEVPGATFELGCSEEVAAAGRWFAFDNERWAHAVRVAPFRIARAPVTEAEFAAFVADDGYARDELWSAEGLAFRDAEGVQGPLCWRREGGGFAVREYDRWRPLRPHRPVMHVSWHEAAAFCRWAGRRLPTEAEWELCACGPVAAAEKARFPWGEGTAAGRAHLDGAAMAPVDVAACPGGDTQGGVRQMIGNVWEWTASTFLPYPGFAPDVYREYSEPWFGTRKVLRGGCFATRARLLCATHRNFFPPERRDLFAGFRTVAADGVPARR